MNPDDMNPDNSVTLAGPTSWLFLVMVFGGSRFAATFGYQRLVFQGERPTFRTSTSALTTHPPAVTR